MLVGLLEPKRLEKLFWWIGCVSLAVTLYVYLWPFIEELRPSRFFVPMPGKEFSVLDRLEKLFSAISETAFAFFISATFGVVAGRSRSDRDARILHVLCVALFAQSLLKIVSSANFYIRYAFGLDGYSGFDLINSVAVAVIGLTTSVVSALAPAMLAVIVFALWSHFSKLIDFEAEVI